MTKIKKTWLLIGLSVVLSNTLFPGVSGQLARDGNSLFRKLENLGGQVCSDCHYSVEPDTINWNPSLYDLAGRTSIYSTNGLGSYFDSPKGKLVSEVHKGISLSESDGEKIIDYLKTIEESEAPYKKPFKIRLTLFMLMFLFLILLRIEKKKIKKLPRTVRIVIGLAVWTALLTITVQDAIAIGRSKNYSPVQPIKFSHQIHATDNKIDCKYCHSGVLIGKNAGIPPVSLCMNCHKHQQEGTRTGFFEIRKVIRASEDSIPIRWVRIHNLPDHVYFNHMQHVKVGKLDCVVCHGDLTKSHIVKQQEDLSMGWCLRCHDTRAVDFSNEYYKTYYSEFLDSLRTGKIDSVMVSDVGGRDCSQCHY